MEQILSDRLGKSAGYKRKELPQVDLDDIPKIVSELVLRDKVGFKVLAIAASRIKFTQDEIDKDKVESKRGRGKRKQYKYRLFLLSRGWYTVDGHHDVAHALLDNPKQKLMCFVFDLSIHELIDRINQSKISYNGE